MTDKDREPKVMTLGIGGYCVTYFNVAAAANKMEVSIDEIERDLSEGTISCMTIDGTPYFNYDNLIERYKLGRGLLPI